MNLSLKKWLVLPLLILLVGSFAIACGPGEEEEDTTITGMEVWDRSDDTRVAYVHGNHWHGSLPVLEVDGHRLSVDARFLNADEEEVDVDYDTYSLDARVVDGDEDLVELVSHGDHLHIRPGSEAGSVGIVFVLRNGDELYESPVINVTIVDGDQDFGPAPTISKMVLLDRSTDPHSEIAETDDDHWHGSAPALQAGGERLSVGARFYDEDGEDLELTRPDYEREGGPYQFEARFADGAADDVIEIVSHSDHIHLRPVENGEAGTTQVIFELYFDGELIFESPALEIVVE